MVFTYRRFFWIIVIVGFKRVFSEDQTQVEVNPINWEVVESIAEENPYIIALLDQHKSYICTGAIINPKTVLTSGTCIKPELFYIAVGTAVLNKFINSKNLFKIERTTIHSEYSFELREEELNVTSMHSNLGLVFSTAPTLDIFIASAKLGNYYASELRGRSLLVAGFGPIMETGTVALQFQTYRQSPCHNPKWYYCICGSELSKYTSIYTNQFAEGAPVFSGSELIGVAAMPCGSLELKSVGLRYNIFTIIGPYAAWMEKSISRETGDYTFRSKNSAIGNTCNVLLLAIIQLLN